MAIRAAWIRRIVLGVGLMALSRISTASANASSVSMTTPQYGDLILVFTFNNAATTRPTVPAGYIDIGDGGHAGTTCSGRVAYKFSNGTETTSGTWTNATSIAVGVYRNSDQSVPYGGFKSSNGVSATLSYTTLTVQQNNTTSWVVGFAGHRTATAVEMATAPTGMTNQTSAIGVSLNDTNGVVNSWSTQTVGVTASSGWVCYTVEIVAAQDPTIFPQFVNTVSFQSNENFETGQDFILPLPGNGGTGAGNCLVVGMMYAYSATRAITVTDSSGSGTWSLAAGPVVDTTGNTLQHAIYVKPNCGAGILWVKVHFDAALFDFQANVSEFSGIVLSSPLDGSGAANGSAAPTATSNAIQPGALTTSVDGDLIYLYAIVNTWGAAMEGNTITGLRAGPNMRLLTTDLRIGIISAAGVQTTHGSTFNPAVYDAATTQDGYGVLAIALKTDATKGTPPTGMYVASILHTRVNPGASKIILPRIGNLTVILTTYNTNQITLNSAMDIQGNSHTVVSQAGGYPQAAWQVRATGPTDQDNTISMSTTDHGSGNMQFLLFDIVGAAAAPFDVSAFAGPGGSTGTNAIIAHMPDLTPTTAGGIVLATLNCLTGPPDECTVPANANFDSIFFTGYTDLDPSDSGDGYAHYYNTSVSAQSWTWRDTVASTGTSALALAFTAAPLIRTADPIVGHRPAPWAPGSATLQGF